MALSQELALADFSFPPWPEGQLVAGPQRSSHSVVVYVMIIWVFPPQKKYPQIINFSRFFHYKPSILGEKSPYFRKHPSIGSSEFQKQRPLCQLQPPP